MADQFLKEMTKRRSIYALNDKLPISKDKVAAIIKEAVRQTPSSFNVQCSRVIILFGAEHAALWKLTIEAMKRKGVSGDKLKEAEAKVNGCFASGAGTVLFFNSEEAVEGQRKFAPAYAHNFGPWADQSTAMGEFAVWTALAQEGVGATLQHYNELIEEDVRKQFEVPAGWKLLAQMPFGGIAAPAGEKTFIPDEGRIIVKGPMKVVE